MARRRQLGRHAPPDVGHVGDGGDDERRRHGVTLPVGAGVLVVQRVLARHERGAVGDRRVVAAAHGGDEPAERRRPARVAPREVVEQGDPVGIAADGDDVADRLVDDGVGHRLGVVQAVPRVDADADGDAVGVARVGEHDTVAGPVGARPDERAHDGAAADLVVVAVDRRRLGGDVAVGEQGEQGRPPDRRPCGCPGVRSGRGQRRRPSGAAAGRRAGTPVSRSSTTSPRWRTTRRPSPVKVPRSASSTPWRSQRARSSARRSGGTATTIRSWASDSQISHGARPGYLSGAGGQLDVGAGALGHLADGRRQPAGAAVGDRRPQVVGAGEHVDQQLLGDRVADLHAGPGDLAGRGVHRGAGERRPADAVAPGAPAEHDDAVAGERPVGQRAVGGDADAAAEHERVRRVRRVVEHRAGDGRQADLVAVVGDAVDDALADAPGVQRAVGQVVDRRGRAGRSRGRRCRRSAGGRRRARRG